VLDEVFAQDGRDRNRSACRPALRSDDAFLGIPGTLDVDHAGAEVDVLPAKGEELATSKARVHCGRPQRTVALGERSEPRRSFRWRGDPVSAALHSRKLEAGRRVHGDLAAGECAAEDRPQGHERVSDGTRVEAFGAQPVGESWTSIRRISERRAPPSSGRMRPVSEAS
jgi:hypothetical protein